MRDERTKRRPFFETGESETLFLCFFLSLFLSLSEHFLKLRLSSRGHRMMADRVPLPRVSTAYAAATAGANGVGIESTAPAAASASTTTTNPLEAPVARAALLTMASELKVLDTLGFLSGPVGGGRDFTKAYR